METIRQILSDSVSGGFWTFAGYWGISVFPLAMAISLIRFLISRPLKHREVMKHGYNNEIKGS